jgi:hypothetical protein
MNRIHPVIVIVIGLLFASIGFNILFWKENRQLVYTIQRLEAGPARGLFHKPQDDKPKISDEKLNELIKKLLEKMINEKQRKNIT